MSSRFEHLRFFSPPSRSARWAMMATMMAVVVATGPAGAGPCSQATAEAIGTRPGLYVEQEDGSWSRAGARMQAEGARRFAFVGRRTDKVPAAEGATAVRISRLRADAAETAVKRIALRRPDAAPSCGPRTWRVLGLRVLGWRGLDFVAGQRVDVDTYIVHHLFDQDASSVLTDFHVDYRSMDEGCVSSQKNAGGRRTAFLAVTDDDAIATVPLVARSVRQQVVQNFGIGSAIGAPATNGSDFKSRLQLERQAFAEFGAVESQIHTYPLNGERMCVTFAPASAIALEPGARWKVEFVDLDERDARPRRRAFDILWQ